MHAASFRVYFAVAVTFCFVSENANSQTPASNQEFRSLVHPFLNEFCFGCHDEATMESGVRLDHLTGELRQQNLKLWTEIRSQLAEDQMPPDESPQPAAEKRKRILQWLDEAIAKARRRKVQKNGITRRLTVAQYQNTLESLVGIQDDLSDRLPPDAMSKDGFPNDAQSMILSPILVDTYFSVAEEMLDRALVDPSKQPRIQSFRVELGKSINPNPFPDKLILGANNHLLSNADFQVVEPAPAKPFPYLPLKMRTKYRFNEGYQGNATVRGWREYNSIYHAVFACMRGNPGYPKGKAYEPVPQGLLLRPAIPSAELFAVESTYGPRANFKISTRQLPDRGRFQIKVNAARYNDGLLLERKHPLSTSSATPPTVTATSAMDSIDVPQAGIYRIDVSLAGDPGASPPADASKLKSELAGEWDFESLTDVEESPAPGTLTGGAELEPSPFGTGLFVNGRDGSFVVPRNPAMDVGSDAFTVAAWIHPTQLKQGGIVCLGKYSWTHGWYFDMPNNQGVLRIETVNPQNMPNGTVSSRPGVIRLNAWQHVAAVVRRSPEKTRLYVNGYEVAAGSVGAKNLDNPNVDLHLGRIQDAQGFAGSIDNVCLYHRALSINEIQALIEPGRQFVKAPPREKPQDFKLTLGERNFSGKLQQPAFIALRLAAGPLKLAYEYAGHQQPKHLSFRRLSPTDPLAQELDRFEQRAPKVGVYLGLRRDCGSTLAEVSPPQSVRASELNEYVFQGAIGNFPSPDVQPDNDNYLAGIREIAVRSVFTDQRDIPRLLIRSVEFEGPFYDSWPPASHRSILLPRELNEDDLEYAKRVLTHFADRAFRRPATQGEIAQILKVYRTAKQEGQSLHRSIQDALVVILTSPQFLFIIENSHSPEAEELDSFELASKLSYFLWNGPPDDQLLRKATKDRLHSTIAEEVDRMIQDSRFERFTQQFGAHWLNLDKFDVVETDRKRYPELTRHAKFHLRRQPIKLMEHLIRENLPVRNFVKSDFILANEPVASYYGLGEKCESGLQYEPLVHRRPDLGGLLTQASILAGLSNGRDANPIKRGAWVARKIIAQPPADPPPNVPPLAEAVDESLSLQEKLRRHRDNKGCAGCHQGIDPWGIPLQTYDAAGIFKALPEHPTSTLPDDTDIAGVTDLQTYLSDRRLEWVVFSFAKHLMTYACGKALTFNELEQLKADCAELADANVGARDVLDYVIHSDIYLMK